MFYFTYFKRNVSQHIYYLSIFHLRILGWIDCDKIESVI